MSRDKLTKRNKLARQIANEIIDANVTLSPQNFLNCFLSQFPGGVVGFCKEMKIEWDAAKPGSNMKVTITKLVTGLMIHQTAVQKQYGGDTTDVSEEELEELVQEELSKITSDEDESDEPGSEEQPDGDGPA